MRAVLAFLMLGALAATPAAAAEPRQQSTPIKPEQPRQQRLDDLFRELKREHSEAGAKRIADRIWTEWYRSGSSSIDLMMGWARKAMDEQKWDVALDFLDQVVTLDPQYSEGWNRRATVHFLMHNFKKSMADIERTLELEPRHFGALSGMAQIMQANGAKALAISAYQRVVDVYPMDRSAQNQIATLSEEIAGEAI